MKYNNYGDSPTYVFFILDGYVGNPFGEPAVGEFLLEWELKSKFLKYIHGKFL